MGRAGLRVGVLASGVGSNLQALLDAVDGRDGIRVGALGTDRDDAPAIARAHAAGLPVGVFPASSFADRVTRDLALADWLAGHHVRLVVLAGYTQLCSPEFLARFPGAVINVHPALLPSFPGLDAPEQALAYGVKVFGVTVHFVDEGVDTGPVILQRSIELPDVDDPAVLREYLHGLEHELLPEAVRLFALGHLSRDPANPRRVLIKR
jgi:phosphoribosylglycinamide formyltransferase-1